MVDGASKRWTSLTSGESISGKDTLLLDNSESCNRVPNEQMKSSSGFFSCSHTVVVLTVVWTEVVNEINGPYHACVCVFLKRFFTHITIIGTVTPVLAHGELGI